MMIQENISLKRYNTFGIDATARYFIGCNTVEDVQQVLADKIIDANSDLMVLGGGSNILLLNDVNILVLKVDIPGITIIKENENHIYVKAGAGVNWHAFVLYCLQNDFAGVENLALIPGNVGASPMQNIGAYGVEIKDVVQGVEALHIKDKTLVNFSNAECGFGYRESVFKTTLKNNFIITSVVFKLNKKPVLNTNYGALQQVLNEMNVATLTIQAIAEAVMQIRKSKLPDPAKIGNAGSFFKNPVVTKEAFLALQAQYPGIAGYPSKDGVKLAAGWLIEQCGYKGIRRGDAGCHPKQALVLVNYGNASGNDILSLANEIIVAVQKKFTVTLQKEVNII
ncbi:MAG: UDP-N-acetylmuramate dehydrogenase [Ferruginibacter sp.]